MTETKLLRIPEVASRLNISRSAAYTKAQRREIPVVSMGPRSIRVPADALEAWIVQRTEGGENAA